MNKPTVPQLLARALNKRIGKRPTLEYRFHPSRMWRADLAFVRQKLLIEVDGSRHASLARHRKDAAKRNAAVEMGYKVLTYPAGAVLTKCRLPLIVEQIYRVLCGACDPSQSGTVLDGN